MIRDHRPYFVKKIYLNFQRLYGRRFLIPQMSRIGQSPHFIKPWHIEIFGGPVLLGDCVTIIAAPDAKVRLSIWPAKAGEGGIHIGNYSLICPGVRIGSALRVVIEENCMIASRAYITDSDWHGLYDRLSVGRSAAVRIGPNAWIGDSAIVCKGVTVGKNSVVGAGAVVVDDVPPNAVAAGNPARVVKTLDPENPFTTRAAWFRDPAALIDRIDSLDRRILSGNSVGHWLRHLVFPAKGE